VPHHSRPHHSKPHLTAPIHDCRTKPLLYLPYPHPSRPILDCHTKPRLIRPDRSSPRLPNRNVPLRIAPKQTHPRLPNHKTPHQTAPVLSVKLLDCLTPSFRASYCPSNPLQTSCQTISHPTRPHLYYSLNSSTAIPHLSVPNNTRPILCKLPAAPNFTKTYLNIPLATMTAIPNLIPPHPYEPRRS
jgi:hypothetical protein